MSAVTFFRLCMVIAMLASIVAIGQLVALGASYELRGYGLHPALVAVGLIFNVALAVTSINWLARDIALGE